MPVSSTRSSAKNSFTRRWMSPHEASTTSGVRKAVRRTRKRLTPSTPRRYSMPQAGIHAARSTSWNSASPGRKRPSIQSESANGTSEKTSAARRTPASGSRGRSARSTAPTSGAKTSSVSSGTVAISARRSTRAAGGRRHGEEAPDDGADRQHGEGHGHHRRRFVEVVRGLGRHARFPEEGQADEPPRVVGGERRRDEADDAEDGPRVRASERAV